MSKQIVNKKSSLNRRYIFITLLFLLCSALAVILWNSSRDLTDRQKMLDVQSKVSKLIIVPANEEPTLAEVKDANLLKDSFLKQNAQNGDQVLVYAKASKVYVYRPSISKLAAVGPLTVDPSVAQVTGAKIRVRNGSANADVVSKIEDILKQNYKAAIIESTDSAKRSDFPYTIVVDLTDGKKYDLVTNIIDVIGAVRGVLPSGEEKPVDTDILIITGKK